ncbi:hypothetical protein KY290_032340 [Solanum tuberosum]|uniref:Uncharacterized protein n=1 Tax=Solanum tuberosum TaxID=4113 RepID=A0ABQ7UDK6_SOLTU|nr:hypothetical protein KY290_032340 [Solanum tuberosum]
MEDTLIQQIKLMTLITEGNSVAFGLFFALSFYVTFKNQPNAGVLDRYTWHVRRDPEVQMTNTSLVTVSLCLRGTRVVALCASVHCSDFAYVNSKFITCSSFASNKERWVVDENSGQSPPVTTNLCGSYCYN